jgi:hypothetical protein
VKKLIQNSGYSENPTDYGAYVGHQMSKRAEEKETLFDSNGVIDQKTYLDFSVILTISGDNS